MTLRTRQRYVPQVGLPTDPQRSRDVPDPAPSLGPSLRPYLRPSLPPSLRPLRHPTRPLVAAALLAALAFAGAPRALPAVAAGGPTPGTYDFEHLTVGTLDGQDGWRVTGTNGGTTTVQIPDNGGRNTIIAGHDGSKAARQLQGGGNVTSMAVRRDDANWSITPVSATGVTVIEFEMNHPYWGSGFALGVSSADGTQVTVGIEVLSRNEGTLKHRLAGRGGTVIASHSTRVAQFGRYQVVLDGTAGTASVIIKDLAPASTAGWVAPASLQDIAGGFDTGAGAANPANWDALRLRSDSYDPTSLFDNIRFRTVEPSSRSLDLGDTPLTTTSTADLTLGGLHLTGALSATITGSGFSFPDGTTTRSGVAAGTLRVRFDPPALGAGSGELTLVGDDMARPLVIALTATGTPEPAPTASGSAAATAPVLDCHEVQPIVGRELTCTVTLPDHPGVEILWRAGYNPTFHVDSVVLDGEGRGTLRLIPPRDAAGWPLWIELVAWDAPTEVGVVSGPVPTSIPTGSGPPPDVLDILPPDLRPLPLALSLTLLTLMLPALAFAAGGLSTGRRRPDR